MLTGSDDPEPVYDTVGSLNLEIDQSRLDLPPAGGDVEPPESVGEPVEECVAGHLAVRTKNCVPSASLVTMVPESVTVTVLSGRPVITSTSNAWSAGSTSSPYARPPTGTGLRPRRQPALAAVQEDVTTREDAGMAPLGEFLKSDSANSDQDGATFVGDYRGPLGLGSTSPAGTTKFTSTLFA